MEGMDDAVVSEADQRNFAKTLRETLPGYAEYMKRVRYRLIPGVW